MPADFLLEQPQSAGTNMQTIDGGYLEGQHTAQGFRMLRLHSTNPALYLKNEYAPGSILPPKAHL